MTLPARNEGHALSGGADREELPPPRILSMPAGVARRGGGMVTPRQMLVEIVKDSLGDRQEGGDAARVKVVLDLEDLPVLDVDAATLRRMMEPLLRRSFEAAANSTGLHARHPEVVVTAVAYPEAVEIEIGDTGAGLTACERSSLHLHCDAAMAGRSPADGVMTTLAKIRDQADSLGGTLTATDCPDGGSAVTIRLPLRRSTQRRAA